MEDTLCLGHPVEFRLANPLIGLLKDHAVRHEGWKSEPMLLDPYDPAHLPRESKPPRAEPIVNLDGVYLDGAVERANAGEQELGVSEESIGIPGLGRERRRGT